METEQTQTRRKGDLLSFMPDSVDLSALLAFLFLGH